MINRNPVEIPSAQSLARYGVWFAVLLILFISLLALGSYFAPTIIISGLFGATLIILTHAIIKILAVLSPKPTVTPDADINLWPRYTVLVPIYKEANVVASLITHLAKLDYPRDKLEIFIICEADDKETLAALPAALQAPFKLILVPPSEPRTKPKALNIALTEASGKFITIYDAEDRPHPAQLKAAAQALMSNPELAAVQAPLNYYNSDTNFLTRQFTIEYAALFHVWLPFLARLGLPFPLGGTSNHIRASLLERTQGWDAFNVTEDADMSFRIAANGGRIGYILPPTEEEAVQNLKPWMKQRSRWIKGYLQTWIIHMRRPLAPGGKRGFLRQITLQLTIGLTLLTGFFHVPSLLIVSYLYVFGPPADISPFLMGSFITAYASGLLIGAAGLIRAGKPGLLWQIPFMPLYWLLHFIPALMALYELCVRPFYWHKTEHGVKSSPPPISTKT